MTLAEAYDLQIVFTLDDDSPKKAIKKRKKRTRSRARTTKLGALQELWFLETTTEILFPEPSRRRHLVLIFVPWSSRTADKSIIHAAKHSQDGCREACKYLRRTAFIDSSLGFMELTNYELIIHAQNNRRVDVTRSGVS
jgi:hypothetical protein